MGEWLQQILFKVKATLLKQFSQNISQISSSDYIWTIVKTFSTRVAGILLGLITSILVARTLGPAGRGHLAVAMAIASIAVQFGNLGLHSSNTYFISKNRSLLPIIFGNSLTISLGIGCLGSLLIWVTFSIWPQIALVQGPLLILALVSIPICLCNLLFQNILIGLLKIDQHNKIDLVSKIFSIAIVVVLLVTGNVTEELVLAGGILTLVLAVLWAGNIINNEKTENIRFSLSVFSEHLKYAWKAYLGAFFAFMILRSDLVLVNFFLGDSASGYYSISAGMADMLYILPSTVGFILFPKLASTESNSDKWRLTWQTFKFLSLILFLLVLLSILAAPFLINVLYGEAFLPSILSFQVLCVGMFFYGLNNIYSNFLAAVGFPWAAVYLWITAFIINVISNLLLIPAYGILGAALSSAFCYGAILVFSHIYCKKVTRRIQVIRNFDTIYQNKQDPWDIGEAESPRYDNYKDLILKHLLGREKILDIGCGQGAVLAKFKDDFNELLGLEISETAIRKGQQRYSFINFEHGSVVDLESSNYTNNFFDAILYTDVIFYLTDKQKRDSLTWISHHLKENGIAVVAAWCPGGEYLFPDELKRLIRDELAILEEKFYDTGHAVFLVTPKRRFIALTIDYETWHPIPDGKKINWNDDVFEPTDKLMSEAEAASAPLTFMVEMGEYMWLLKNDSDTAKVMENQWKEILQRGHDIQLHLHPNWLPELNATFENGQWSWDWELAKSEHYPGNLTKLFTDLKERLESVCQTVKPDYQVTSFRAGAYQAQPFSRVWNALKANGIVCDSSIYEGGYSKEREYNYLAAYSSHNPYYASRLDPQLKAPPSENGVIEIPIFTPVRGERWFIDNKDCDILGDRFFSYIARNKDNRTTEMYRQAKVKCQSFSLVYSRLKPFRKWINRILPALWAERMTTYQPENLTEHDYFIAIGHTKAKRGAGVLTRELLKLSALPDTRFVTMTQMASLAQNELERAGRSNAREEAKFQVDREYNAIMGEERNTPQSYRLQENISWASDRLLDLGCGAGYWSHLISAKYPWIQVTGVDIGKDFIVKAKQLYSEPNLDFILADFANLPFGDNSFETVYADNSLEHAWDVSAVLKESHRIICPGGVLLAAVPCDAYNSQKICENHTWKTYPADVKKRLEHAGFIEIQIEEVNTYRQLGMAPYPPSKNIMLYINAHKSFKPSPTISNILKYMDWVYRKLEPEATEVSVDPLLELTKGKALCIGYVIVLGGILKRQGYNLTYITMKAKGHPKGRGPLKIETHEVLQVKLQGKEHIFDPTTNTHIPYSLEDLLKKPALAGKIKHLPDNRYYKRQYHLYDQETWYKSVYSYATRTDVRRKVTSWISNPYI
jgi:O-antigen/teichoic acid export membrane protein/SAM-dependent methyltransferase